MRGAVFSTVSIACEILPSMMSSLSCQVSPAVLSALDDADPAVCQHLWNVVLSVLNNITVRSLLSARCCTNSNNFHLFSIFIIFLCGGGYLLD